MLSRMKLTDEYVGVVVENDDHGLIIIDDLIQLNEKSVDSLFRVLRRPGGSTGGVYNTGVAVSEMAEANLQGIIYFIKNFKRIGHTCTHGDVELSKVRAMYHQRYTEESHKDPEVLPTADSKDWTNTLETVEEYIRVY